MEQTALYTLQTLKGGEVLIELSGVFDKDAACQVEKSLREELASTLPHSIDIFLSFQGVQDCAVDARDIFVNIHRFLMEKAVHIAYISQQPRFRGLALWVLHTAQDDKGKAVSDVEQAHQWLNSLRDPSSTPPPHVNEPIAQSVNRSLEEAYKLLESL